MDGDDILFFPALEDFDRFRIAGLRRRAEFEFAEQLGGASRCRLRR